jgi:hypothetical protein
MCIKNPTSDRIRRISCIEKRPIILRISCSKPIISILPTFALPRIPISSSGTSNYQKIGKRRNYNFLIYGTEFTHPYFSTQGCARLGDVIPQLRCVEKLPSSGRWIKASYRVSYKGGASWQGLDQSSHRDKEVGNTEWLSPLRFCAAIFHDLL